MTTISSTMSSRLLQQTSDALRSGERTAARHLLERTLRAKPHSEQDWLWLAGLVELEAYPADLWLGPGDAAQEALVRLQSRLGMDTRLAVDPASDTLFVVADQLTHQQLTKTFAGE